jgi:hypothetical protein
MKKILVAVVAALMLTGTTFAYGLTYSDIPFSQLTGNQAYTQFMDSMQQEPANGEHGFISEGGSMDRMMDLTSFVSENPERIKNDFQAYVIRKLEEEKAH